MRAQLVVINHLCQTGDTRLEGAFAILIEEELRIGQPGTHHALVALDHPARVFRPDVADDQELVGQLARRIEQRKVLLVRLHRQDQALLRHVQKLGFELAQQDVGPLDQRGHFVEQRRVIDRREALFGRRGLKLARDLAVAGLKTGHHCPLRFKLVRVVIGVLQHHRVDRGLEPVASRLAARLQAERAHRHHVGTVQRHQTVRRADELNRGPAVGELVLHDLRDGQVGKGLVQRLLQTVGQRGAGDHAVEEQRLGLAVHLALEVGHGRCVGAHAGELFQQRGRGIARSRQAHANGHQLVRHGLVVCKGPYGADVRG